MKAGNFLRSAFLGLGILTFAGGLALVLAPGILADAVKSKVGVPSKGVNCNVSDTPPRFSALFDNAGSPITSAEVHDFIVAQLNGGDFDPGRARDPIDLVDYRGKGSKVRGQLLPVKGVCNYLQADMATGQVIGKLVLKKNGGDYWEVESGTRIPADASYLVLVDYSLPDNRWRMQLRDDKNLTVFSDENMVYKSTFREAASPDEVFAPDVGYFCIEAGKFGCMAKPWWITPKALGVDNATQLWAACTKTGCCCSGSGCH